MFGILYCYDFYKFKKQSIWFGKFIKKYIGLNYLLSVY